MGKANIVVTKETHQIFLDTKRVISVIEQRRTHDLLGSRLPLSWQNRAAAKATAPIKMADRRSNLIPSQRVAANTMKYA